MTADQPAEVRDRLAALLPDETVMLAYSPQGGYDVRATLTYEQTATLADDLEQGRKDKAEVERLTAALDRVRALHPKIENPRQGCCAAPKLCEGHPPACGGRDHGINRPQWPCPTIAAIDGQPEQERASSNDLQDLARLIESMHDECGALVARAHGDPAVNRAAVQLIEPLLACLAGHARRLAGPERTGD